jgi:TonB family protein
LKARGLITSAWVGLLCAIPGYSAYAQWVPTEQELFADSLRPTIVAFAKARGIAPSGKLVVSSLSELGPSPILVSRNVDKAYGDSIASRFKAALQSGPRPQNLLIEFKVKADSLQLKVKRARFNPPAILNKDRLSKEFSQQAGIMRVNTGRVVLRVLVGPTGRAEDAKVISNSATQGLADVALQLARNTQYISCRVEGLPFSCWLQIPFVLQQK